MNPFFVSFLWGGDEGSRREGGGCGGGCGGEGGEKEGVVVVFLIKFKEAAFHTVARGKKKKIVVTYLQYLKRWYLFTGIYNIMTSGCTVGG